VVAAVAATVAHALAFDDASPCRDTHPDFVCPAGTVDSSYSITFQAGGGCGPALPYQYRILNGALPAGLSLSSNGVLSGTPTTAGTASFWVELSDEDPPSQSWCLPKKAERPFSLTIEPRVLVTTESAAPGTVGSPYSLGLSAAMKSGPDSTAPPSSALNWTIVAGTIPPGVTLDASTGVLSGTPTTEGAYGFTVQAALIDGRSDTKGLTITVRQPLTIAATKPFATSPLPTVWEVGVPFASKLIPSGGTGMYTFAVTEGSLPTGMAVAADGSVVGKPTSAGVYRATLRLSDDEGRTADYAANFAVATRLAVRTRALRPGKVGRLYRAKVASIGGVLPRAWKIVRGPLPKGVRFDRRTGALRGIPKKPGRYRVAFQVTDGLKVVAKRSFRIIILGSKRSPRQGG
jgi:large repetitive protein